MLCASANAQTAPYQAQAREVKVYRAAGIPTFASSGLFAKPSEMFAHGLNERLPVVAFYQGLDHIYRLAIEFAGSQGPKVR